MVFTFRLPSILFAARGEGRAAEVLGRIERLGSSDSPRRATNSHGARGSGRGVSLSRGEPRRVARIVKPLPVARIVEGTEMSVLMVFCGLHLPLAFHFVCGPGGGEINPGISSFYEDTFLIE